MKLNNLVFDNGSFAAEMAKLRDGKRFDYLVTIVGEDFGEEGLGCIYILENTDTNERLSVKEMAEARKSFATEQQFKQQKGLDAGRPIIALLPGSRHKEIRDNLPEMVAACGEFPGYQPVIGGAPSIDEEEYRNVLRQSGIAGGENIRVLHGCSFELVAHARAAVVTSGTATLETAVLGTPQVVCYRMNGSKRVYDWYKRLLKVKYVSLPNLIADEPILPELLLHFCNRRSIARELAPLLGDTPQRSEMLAGYSRMMDRLGTTDCAATAAHLLTDRLRRQSQA